MKTFKDNLVYDFIIIGSGIIGSNIARELAKYQASVLVIEKESDVINGQTIANSGIIHSGHDPKPNTLKARLCVEGNHLAHELAKELNFHLLNCGGLVLAFDEEEKTKLIELYENGLRNQVPGLKLLTKEEVLAREPRLNQNVLMGLDLPTTSVSVPWEMALASLENAVLNGVELKLNSEVTNIKTIKDKLFEIEINHKEFIYASHVINSTGIDVSKVSHYLEPELEYEIKGRKGEYFTLDPKNQGFFHSVLYPIPTKLGKGVLITPQVHGETLIGPTSEDLEDPHAIEVTTPGLARIISDAKKISASIPFYDNIRNFAGIRAKSTYDDFYIKESKYNPGFYHLAGIDSPGLTAAPAIAKYLVNLIKKKTPLKEKVNYIKGRKYVPLFRYLTKEEKIEALKKNPQHGEIVCKCEDITKADVVHALTGIIPSDTIKGIKKRTRAGAGICQGGYCERRVLKLISEYHHKKMTEIDYYEPGTNILLENLRNEE